MKPSVMCVQVYSHKNEVNAVVLWMYGTACSTRGGSRIGINSFKRRLDKCKEWNFV